MNYAEKIEVKNEANKKSGGITYSKLFWLFIAGSLLGILLEGVWYLIKYDHWETHVTTMWIPLCGIYGLGAAGCYAGCVLLKDKPFWVKFIVFCLVGAGIEVICGAALEFGLHMRAWNYAKRFMNFRGYVSLSMAVLWGFLGLAFNLAVPYLEKVFAKMNGKLWRIACIALTVILLADFSLTASCMFRWRDRHENIPPSNKIERYIDEHYDDDFMSERFCEWKFIKK